MPGNPEIDQALALIEDYKADLMAITLGEVLSYMDEVSQEELLSYLSGTGYEYADVQQGLAILNSYPPSMTMYDFLYEMLTSAAGSGGSIPGQLVEGTDADDVLVTAGGNDTIYGGAGNDELIAGAGNDTIYGGAGNDVLTGGTGSDYMEGGSGADTYYVDNKKDAVKEDSNDPEALAALILKIDLGSTVDTVVSSVKYTLTSYVENLQLAESSKKLAGTGNDLGNIITGNSTANKLLGQSGNDTIDGGGGADKLSGGAGADTFRFSSLDTADSVSDFSEEDFLSFDTTVFTHLSAATSGNFVIGTTAVDTNDYLIFSDKTATLYYDADGSGSGGAIKIVALKGADSKTLAFDDLSFA
jgi:Ca2+-binding RTX toxin-like protein